MAIANIARIVVGALVLVLGRRLYWLFVGAIGFAAGIALATRYLADQPELVMVIAAVAAGLIGAVAAVFLQQLAVGVAGFIAGGYLAQLLLEQLGLDLGGLEWVGFVVGGIVGALLVALLFDWALIILSAFSGGTLIVQGLALEPPTATIILVVLFVVGIVVQATVFRPPSRPTRPSRPAGDVR